VSGANGSYAPEITKRIYGGTGGIITATEDM